MKQAIISLNRTDTAVKTDGMSIKASKAYTESEGKEGVLTASFLTRKAYGIANSLKGAALRKAHDGYRVERSRTMGGELARMVTTQQIHITRLSQKVNGSGTIGFVQDLGASAPDAHVAELESLIEKLTAALGGSKQVAALLAQQSADTVAALAGKA